MRFKGEEKECSARLNLKGFLRCVINQLSKGNETFKRGYVQTSKNEIFDSTFKLTSPI